MKTKEAKIYGDNAKRVRMAKGLTQEAVAKSVGVRVNRIGILERAKTDPLLSSMELLARGLKTPLHELLKP